MSSRHVHEQGRGGAEPQDFRAARGRVEDEEWAADAWLALVLHGQVSAAAAEGALGEVLALVRESGEGPADLYGPPDRWAQEHVEEWAAEGSLALRDEPARWRDLPQVAAVTAVLVTLLAALVCALKGEWSIDWTLAWVLLPLLGSLVGLGAVTAWERTVARHPVGVGVAVAGGVVALGSVAIAGLFALTNPHPLAHATILWHLPLAAAYAALAWALGRLVPDPPPARRSVDDEAWAAELARILRTRGDTTEPQVRRLLDEARAHAQHTGSTLAEEFGSPAAYAAQVSPRPVVRARRSALYRVGMLALWVWLCWEGLAGDSRSVAARAFLWICLVCLTVLAVQACWQYLRAARRA